MPTPNCKACGGTGKNSHGGQCYPCGGSGKQQFHDVGLLPVGKPTLAQVTRPSAPPVVTVSYLKNGLRTNKRFLDAYAAKAFYSRKYIAGASPHIVPSSNPSVQESTMSPEPTTAENPTSETTNTAAPRRVQKKAAKTTKATTKKGKTVTVKSAKTSTGNLKLEDARHGILKALARKNHTRTELKAAVPYGNYTGLIGGLEEDGLVKTVKDEGEAAAHVEITAKGRKALEKK